MDSRLSVRIAYYTGWLMPEMEGISKEVFTLAKHFNSTIIGISNLQPIKIDFKNRVFGFSTRWYYCSRILSFLMSKIHTINHIYDSLDNWLYLSSIFSKKTILTGVVGNGLLPLTYYQRLNFLVVDSEERRNELIQKGFKKERIKLIYPGLNLNPFLNVPYPMSIRPFRVLFASSPPTTEELESRGVFDLLEAAENLPDVEFIFLWRPWGDSLQRVKDEIEKRNLENICLICEKVVDVRKFYKKCHIAVAPFKKNGGKSCPTFVIESLASGRPVILGPGVGIKRLIQEANVGLYYNKGSELSEKIQILRDNWGKFAHFAREFAKEFFSINKFVDKYQQLYERVLDE